MQVKDAPSCHLHFAVIIMAGIVNIGSQIAVAGLFVKGTVTSPLLRVRKVIRDATGGDLIS